MGEPSLHCHPSPAGCCLELHETIVILVVLIILVHLALKLAIAICHYICYLLGSLFGMIFVKVPKMPKAAAAATAKLKKAQERKPSARWTEQDIPERRRQRPESSSPSRRCLHCTLEPVKVTMNLQNEPCPFQEQHRVRRRPCPDHLPCQSPRYYNCHCEARPRHRAASAPSGYTVTRCRDVGCGSSDPIVGGVGTATEGRHAMLPATDSFARAPSGEPQYRTVGTTSQEVEYLAPPQRSHRPTKVYIYPVHPQTPPVSRSASPERLFWRRTAAIGSQEEPPERDSQEARRKLREPEQQLSLAGSSRFHTMGTSTGQGAPQAEPLAGKQRHHYLNQLPSSEWVYRPKK